jgi:hypothetical protein
MNNQYLLQFNCITAGRHVNDIQRSAFRQEPRGVKKQQLVTMWIMAEKNSAVPFMYGMKNTAPVGWPHRTDKKKAAA